MHEDVVRFRNVAINRDHCMRINLEAKIYIVFIKKNYEKESLKSEIASSCATLFLPRYARNNLEKPRLFLSLKTNKSNIISHCIYS